jgi:mannose-6-phosphate isomerase-like protein (cupin superfamily)
MKIEKPWGYEELIETNEKYTLKKIMMSQGHRCSLQYHNKKHETFFVLSGKLKFIYGADPQFLTYKILLPGDSFVIPPKLIHRMEGLEDSIYLEASTSELDDVVRLEDNYDRK